MTITHVFFRIWKAISLPLLVATLLISYFNLPDQVALSFKDNGKAEQFIGKQSFFYWSVAIIMFVNLLLGAFGRSLKKALIKILPKNLKWSETPIQTEKMAEGWVNGLTAILNTFMILSLVALNKANATDDQHLSFNFNWILIASIAIFMLIVFYLPLSMLYTTPEEEA
jgi:hypothetical protein